MDAKYILGTHDILAFSSMCLIHQNKVLLNRPSGTLPIVLEVLRVAEKNQSLSNVHKITYQRYVAAAKSAGVSLNKSEAYCKQSGV